MNTNSSRHLKLSSLLPILLAIILSISLLFTPAFLGLAPQAHAVTAAEKQAEVDEAFQRLDALQTEINQLTIDYNIAVATHADAEARMISAQEREEAAKTRLAELQELLGNRASNMYRNGNGSYLDVLFGAQTFSDFVTAVDLINRVNEQNAQMVAETKTLKQEAEEARIEYTEQEKIAREKQEQIGTLKEEKEATEVSMQAEIAALQEEAAELLAKEKLEAEAAERAAANTGVGTAGDVSDDQMSALWALNMQYPFSSRQPISSGFGWRSFDNSFHLGTDFAAPGGTPVLAIAPGTVAAAGWHNLMGNYVIISHGNGIRSIYMHASGLAVSAGQYVSAGDVVSYVGTTGNSTGNHLHLQIEVNLVAVNPMLFF